MAINWDHITQPRFDRIVEALVHRLYAEDAEVEVMNGRGGDGGIDIKVTLDGRVRIHQLKYFPDGFPGSYQGRRSGIKRSFMPDAPQRLRVVMDSVFALEAELTLPLEAMAEATPAAPCEIRQVGQGAVSKDHRRNGNGRCWRFRPVLPGRGHRAPTGTRRAGWIDGPESPGGGRGCPAVSVAPISGGQPSGGTGPPPRSIRVNVLAAGARIGEEAGILGG